MKLPQSGLLVEEALEQAGSRGFSETDKGTFCSRKRPSMMLLHRSSSRLRSTMWSRTSSPGLTAERPRSLLAHVLPPTRPASDTHLTVYTPYLGLWAWSPGPPTQSPQRAVCARCGSHAASAADGAALSCAPPCNCQVGSLGQGRPAMLTPNPASLLPPASSPSLPSSSRTPWPHQRPHTTAPCTLQASAPVVAAGHCLRWRH